MSSESEVVVKVFIDEREYLRLLKTEELYKKMLAQDKNLSGSGTCTCGKKVSLSEVIATNNKNAQIHTPVAGILPDITNPYEAEAGNSNTKPWYFLGQPK